MPRSKAKQERGIREVSPGVWEINVSAGIDPAKSAAGTKQYRRVYRRVTGTITDARNAGKRYDLVVAGMVMIGLIGLILDIAVRSLEKFDEVRWGYANKD